MGGGRHEVVVTLEELINRCLEDFPGEMYNRLLDNTLLLAVHKDSPINGRILAFNSKSMEDATRVLGRFEDQFIIRSYEHPLEDIPSISLES